MRKQNTTKQANRKPNRTNRLDPVMSHSSAIPPAAGPLPRRSWDYRAVRTSLQGPSVMLSCFCWFTENPELTHRQSSATQATLTQEELNHEQESPQRECLKSDLSDILSTPVSRLGLKLLIVLGCSQKHDC